MPGEPVLDEGGGAGQVLLTENGLLVDFRFVHTAAFIGNRHMAPQSGRGILGTHAPVGNEQLTDLLVHGHLLDVSGRTLRGAQTPVIDRADLAGTVNILEVQAVFPDHRTVHGADSGTVGVFIDLKMVACLDSHGSSSFLLHTLLLCQKISQNPSGNPSENTTYGFVKENDKL